MYLYKQSSITIANVKAYIFVMHNTVLVLPLGVNNGTWGPIGGLLIDCSPLRSALNVNGFRGEQRVPS
jgi:hypothetical protein